MRGIRFLGVIVSRVFIPVILTALGIQGISLAASGPRPQSPDHLWPEIGKLVENQKTSEAVAKLQQLRTAASKSGDEKKAFLAFIRIQQLRVALHEYESVVKAIIEFQKESKQSDEQLNLRLAVFYSQALFDYYTNYQHEIDQREKVDAGTAKNDIRRWTRDQIATEIIRSLEQPWKNRESLQKIGIAEFGDFIVKNSYPAGVRDSMRDFVSYLLVDVLANTSLWSPIELNEKYKISIATMVEKSAAKSSDSLLVEPIHPLQKIAGVLLDLEKWHLSSGRADGAMSARIDLVKNLYSHLDKEGDQSRVKKWLSDYLTQNRTIAWWTVGVATLAEFEQSDGNLMEAHRLVTDCASRFKDSVGAKICGSIKEDIEQPRFDFAGMKLDQADKRSFQLSHKNIKKVFLRAWPIDIYKEIKVNNQEANIVSDERQEQLLKKKPEFAWTVELPDTPDFRMHKTYISPPAKALKQGAWVITASASSDFKLTGNTMRSTFHVVSDLVLLKRSENTTSANTNKSRKISAFVVSGSSGQPIPGVAVELFKYDWQSGHKLINTATTDTKGEVVFENPPQNGGALFMIASRKLSSTSQEKDVSPDPDAIYIYNHTRSDSRQRHLIYTDRAVYRPTQTINWKVLAYEGDSDSAKLKIAANSEVSVQLLDSNWEQVNEIKTVTNKFGTAAGNFTIPAGRTLGQWTIQVNKLSQRQVKVEEYKRPTFEVELNDPVGAVRVNNKAELKGNARFYFGQPVAEGTLKWTVSRSPNFPWWWDYFYRWDFDFGGSRYSRLSDASAEIVAAGTSKLDSDGTFAISFLPEADPEKDKESGLSYNFEVQVDVTDSGGETRSTSKSYRVGFASIEATISLNSANPTGNVFVLDKGKPKESQSIAVRRFTLNGKASPGVGSWKIFPLIDSKEPLMPSEEFANLPPQSKGLIFTPGDKLQSRWAPYPDLSRRLSFLKDDEDSKNSVSGTLKTGDSGTADISIKGLSPGPYRVRYETKDEFGTKVTAWKEFIIAGETTPLAVPLFLTTSAQTAKVGQSIQVVIGSAFKSQNILFEKFRGDELITREFIDSNAIVQRNMTIENADRGGFSLVATIVKDHQIARIMTTVNVPWDNKELAVSFTTFRDKLTPGATEVWTVEVKGPNAIPKSAEVLAFMYDRSLDIFGAHSLPSPLSLFPIRYNAPTWSANLGQAQVNYIGRGNFGEPRKPRPVLRTDQIIGVDGYSLGGFGSRNSFTGRGVNLSKLGLGVGRTLSRSSESDGQTSEYAMMADADSDESAPAAAAPMAKNSPMKEQGLESTSLNRTQSAPSSPSSPAIVPRQNFTETAFWMPQLLADKNGRVKLEFKLPDSVTSWRVFAQAISQDLSSGTAEKEARSIKDLMVRPYAPRFLREGDDAEIKVVVNNASDATIDGQLVATMVDPATGQDISSQFNLKKTAIPFSAAKQGSATLTLSIKAPNSLPDAALKVTATSKNLSDGELRPLPVLPSRVRLMQSRFVTLNNQENRSIKFATDAVGKDTTTDQVVVSVDAQLFETVIKALPSLIRNPYECTDTILNRFVSTAIMDRIYGRYPAIAKAAEDFGKKRSTQLDPWRTDTPNRLLSLEETPWLVDSRGGAKDEENSTLENMLLPNDVKALRRKSIEQLQAMQTSSGGFPWFPGGPPSSYMTMLVVDGIARAGEFGVIAPEYLSERAWTYLGQYFKDDLQPSMISKKVCCLEALTYLNYLISSYPKTPAVKTIFPKEVTKRILDHTFTHWRSLSPRIKAYLIMTLHRSNRDEDARKVLASVMDSAKSDKDRGTWWAPEERSWLWYNDTIESHALALRTLVEIQPDHPKKDGLVTWLMINKKLNQWKSTRATSEVVFALARALEAEKTLGTKQEIAIATASQTDTVVFEPNKYEGQKQIVIRGKEAQETATSPIQFSKKTQGLAFASATWSFATTSPEKGDGDFFSIDRKYFRRVVKGREFVLQPLGPGDLLAVGDEVEVHLSLSSRHEAEYVHLRDPRAAGFEPVSLTSRYQYSSGISWYEEIRDSGTNFFLEKIPVGEFTLKYRIRCSTAGSFKVGPAQVQSMYAPEFAAYTAGSEFKIK